VQASLYSEAHPASGAIRLVRYAHSLVVYGRGAMKPSLIKRSSECAEEVVEPTNNVLAVVATIVVSVESLVPQGVAAILGSSLLLAALAVDHQVVTGDQR